MGELAAQGRVIARVPGHAGRTLWVATETTRAVRARAALVGGGAEGDRSRAARGSRVPSPRARSPNRWDCRSSRSTPRSSALQTEGFALRGYFTPEAAEEEWCERGLLARIHRYTVKRLRAEIEPVQARDFLRFLFEWQRVLPDARMQGSDAVAAVLAQLEGFEAAAAAWETDILPMRISEYEPEWLDEHCRSGRFVWIRLAARTLDRDRGAAPIRSTPITLLARRSVKAWSAFTDGHDREQLTSRARAVMEFIQDPGASFFDEIAENVGMLPLEVEEALAELVALGIVNSDSFGGLRALLVPSNRRGRSAGHGARRKRHIALFAMADAGRWAIVRRARRRIFRQARR